MHIAQGVIADTRHGVVTGQESGQQLYTMLTRGRTVSHIDFTGRGRRPARSYLVRYAFVLGQLPSLREQVLARDAIPQSATTLRRDGQDSAVGLRAAARYMDALHLAAEHIADPQLVASLDQSGDLLLNGLTGKLAGRPLRGHLLLLARAGADPVAELLTAAALPPVVHGQVRRSRDLRARIMEKALKLFREST